jgi:TRAP-type C4-dicarboxylate transport system permease small subunit
MATTPPPGADEHVLNAAGEFDVHDEPIDLAQYHHPENWLAFALFWVLALTIFYQFFTRYALNDSASWTEEIARYLLICTVFVGCAINVRKNTHIQVDFFYRFMPRWVSRPASTAVDGIRIAFFAYCVWLTVSLMMKIGSQRMAIVDWPIGLMYGVVAFGFALMTWRAAGIAIGNWKRGYSMLERPELADEMH